MIGSVSAGSSEVGLIVWTPLPGMLKLMGSGPGVELAQMMASRSDPAPESDVLTTIRLQPTSMPALNSDVLPAASVAVATNLSPRERAVVEVNVAVFVCPASAAAYVSDPTYVCPSLPSESALKNSTRSG